MLLADSNVWLALALSKHAAHPAVRGGFARQKRPQAVLFCRSTQQSFLRLLSTRAGLAAYGIAARTNTAAWSAFEVSRGDQRIGWADEPCGPEPAGKTFA